MKQSPLFFLLFLMSACYFFRCDTDISLYDGTGRISYVILGETLGLADRGVVLSDAFLIFSGFSVEIEGETSSDCYQRIISSCYPVVIDLLDNPTMMIEDHPIPSDRYDGYYIDIRYPYEGELTIPANVQVTPEQLQQIETGLYLNGEFPILGATDIVVPLTNESISLEVPGETLSLLADQRKTITMHIRLYEWFARIDWGEPMDQIQTTVINNIKGTWPYEATIKTSD